MKPHILIISSIILCIACTQATNKETHSPDRPPNIILIMADDLGHETLNCYGGTSYSTPRLDAMAAGGMLFEHCYSTPLCTPSRVQIMTGKYNFRNYIGFGLLAPDQQTFGHLMKAQGYETCIVGKWQLFGNEQQRKLVNLAGVRPEDAGFDDFCLWQIEDRGFRFKDPTIESKRDGLKTYPEKYGPDMFYEYLADFMERKKDTSFFAYFPMVLTHGPFLPTPDMEEFAAYKAKDRTNDTTYFRNMVNYMDKIVGQIIDKAAALGIEQNTLIMFIGDNGTDRRVISYKGSQKIPGRKGYPVEWGTHVPFISYWPGTIQAEQRNENLIDFTDFLPSIVEASGGVISKDFFTDGNSFYSQLIGEQSTPRDWIFCSYAPNWGKFTPSTYVQDRRYKLYTDGRFYDFQTDLMEEHPIDTASLKGEAKASLEMFREVLADMETESVRE